MICVNIAVIDVAVFISTVQGPDVGSTSFPPYLRAFSQFDVGVTLNLRLESIRREGNRLVGVFFDEYGRKRVERVADQIVVDHGATPVDDLYFALKPGSRIVSHRFLLGDWKPEKTETMQVDGETYKIHLWTVEKKD